MRFEQWASIQKRKNKNGTSHWRAVVRIKGFPTVCSHWDRKQEAEGWAQGVECQIKIGQFKFERVNIHRTFADLVQRYISDGALFGSKKRRCSSHELLEIATCWLCACPSYTRASFKKSDNF